MKKRLAVLALAGTMAVSTLAGCSGKLNDSDVVATVDGDDISLGVANFYARMVQAEYETYYAGYMGEDMWNSEASEGKNYEEFIKDQIMETLEEMYLLEDHMDEYEVTIDEAQERSIDNAVKEFDEANSLEEKEKVSGTSENVKEVLRLLTIRKEMSDAIRATADQEVSDEEAAQKKMQYVEYSFTKTDEEGNSTELTDDEKAALKTSAETFAQGAASAADFAAYASENGTEAKETAFDANGTTEVPEELAKEADKLEEGQVTGVVETENGYYVAKVTSLFDKDATEAKKEEIRAERKEEKYTETVDGWKKEAKITVKERVWNKVDFQKLGVTMKIDESDPYSDEVKTDDQAENSEAGE